MSGCRALPFVAVAAVGHVAACSSSVQEGPTPQVSLAESRGAQSAFSHIEKLWRSGDTKRHPELLGRIEAFLAEHEDDPRTADVRAYAVWVALLAGHDADAKKQLSAIKRRPPGVTSELLRVADAAVVRAAGDSRGAIEMLEPLRRKLVDSRARSLLGEQLTRAALGAGLEAPAWEYLLEWRAHTGELELARTERIAGRLIEVLAVDWVEREHNRLLSRTPSEEPEQAGAEKWLQTALRARLVRHALRENDVALAKRLLLTTPVLARKTPSTVALRALANEAPTAPKVAGRAVGIALSLGTESERRRSAEVAFGATRRAEWQESQGGARIDVLVRDDGGDRTGLLRALASLAGAGAAVLVAGVSEQSATAALDFAETQHIPLLLLSEVDAPPALDFAFQLGVGRELERSVLVGVARDRSLSHAIVGPGGVDCSVSAPRAGAPRFPVGEWRRVGVGALLLLGDARCSRDVVREAESWGLSPLLLLGVESAHDAAVSGAGSTVRLGFGGLADGGVDEQSAAFQRFVGRRPSWYQALGWDAVALAWAALAGMDVERLDEKDEVERFHRRVTGSLRTVETPLWTSESGGFRGKHRLVRTPRLVEVSPP